MNTEQVQQILVEDIIPNRFQPRLTFDEKALKELSDSIKVHGVIQPLVLRKVGNKYEIIAGERRYKASCMAGLKQVPAIVRDMNDNDSAEIALIENVQRKNLSSIEEAKSYRNLLDRGYLTQEELASKLGVTQATIANKIRLLNLCDEVQDALLNEQISERHARSLLQIDDPDKQVELLNKIIKERLTVRQLDTLIKNVKAGEPIDTPKENPTPEVAPETQTEAPTEKTTEEGNMDGNTNLFGMTKEVDLEESAPNLINDNVDPSQQFNPFSDEVQTDINNAPEQPTDSNAQDEANGDIPQEGKFFNFGPDEENTSEESNESVSGGVQNTLPPEPEPPAEPETNIFDSPQASQEPTPAQEPVTTPEPVVEQPVPEPEQEEPIIPVTPQTVEVDSTAAVVDNQEPVETFDMFGDEITPEETTTTNEDAPQAPKLNIGDKISEIRNTIDSVKNSGFVVDSEEYDLEDSYQINIIIKKPQD